MKLLVIQPTKTVRYSTNKTADIQPKSSQVFIKTKLSSIQPTKTARYLTKNLSGIEPKTLASI